MESSKPATAPMLYPTPSEAAVKLQYIGQHLADVQAPAAVIDAAVVRRNCRLMLEATEKLGVGFRAHVKTHKVLPPHQRRRVESTSLTEKAQTTQITRLQVGEASQSVKLVCSTVAEIENLLPWLLECQGRGKDVDVRSPRAMVARIVLSASRSSTACPCRYQPFLGWQASRASSGPTPSPFSWIIPLISTPWRKSTRRLGLVKSPYG